ncbi:MAG: purine-nucleoside phosphorylase [Kiritimatiellia bacterium]
MNAFAHLQEENLTRAADACRELFPGSAPVVGLIMGSGWSQALHVFRELKACPSSAIPGLGRPSVAGHDGRIVLGECHGVQTLIFQGRRHWYEGEGWLPVVLPLFLMKRLGVRSVLLTNAAGGIRPDLQPGSLCMVRDHLNLMGDHPFRGPHQPLWGPRFPDLSHVYSPEWISLFSAAACDAGEFLTEGVYAALSGPSYETPAEVLMLAQAGADLVGMSTVPEAIAARSCGLRVAALSCITNLAAGRAPDLSHDHVLAVSRQAGGRLGVILDAAWNRLSQTPALLGEKR